MKSLLKKILLSPFFLLDRIKWRGDSILWRCVNGATSDETKLQFVKQEIFLLMAGSQSGNRFRVASYLNALRDGSSLSQRFATNLIENLTKYESQLGQDCLVDTIFNGKTNGVFVEIGVGNGKTISNTYFLEKERNWTGVLCEPSVKFHEPIRQSRAAVLVTDAVFDKSGVQLKFNEVIGNEELSTLSGQTLTDSHYRSSVKQYAVSTISFGELYERYLSPNRIDYLSVDTEGSELTIIRSIDFGRIDISVISVEHNYNKDKLNEITLILERQGYVEVLPSVFEFDSIFVRREIEQNSTTASH